MGQTFRTVVTATIVSIILVAIGHCFVLQRTFDGPTKYLTIKGDTLNYIGMIENGCDSVRPPFRYRIIVPLLARVMPYPPAESLRAISYISLFISYLVMQLICFKLNIKPVPSVAGLLVVFTAYWHLYNYYNPFLIDAFGLAALSLMLYGLVCDAFMVFLIAALFGVLARETCLFLVPVWLLKDYRHGIPIVVIVCVTIILLRIDTSSDLLKTANNALQTYAFQRLCNPILFGKEIIMSWHFAWLFTIVGTLLFTGLRFVHISGAFFALAGGALLSSLVSADLGRMFAILSPVVAIASAQFFSKLSERGFSVWVYVFIISLLAGSLMTIPNVVLNEEIVHGRRGLQLIIWAGESLLITVAAVLIRKDIMTTVLQNWKLIKGRGECRC